MKQYLVTMVLCSLILLAHSANNNRKTVQSNFLETHIETIVNTLSVDKPVDASIETLSIETSVETYSVDIHSLKMSVETHFEDALV